MDDILGRLLGSPARVKLLRLFLFNPGAIYPFSDIVTRARVSSQVARSELAVYESVGLIKVRKVRGKRERAFILNSDFAYLAALQHLLLNLPVRSMDIAKRLRKVGAIKLVILSGIFVDDYQGRIDLFVVGDRVNETKLKGVIRGIEAEIGKELRYVALPSNEFRYRLDIYDKLVRDVLDYPHTVALDYLHLPLR